MTSTVLVVTFAAAFVLIGCVTSLIIRFALARFFEARSFSTTLRALLIFAPWIIATLGCLALALPDPFSPCHCTLHGLHHPHICLSHPAYALPLFGHAVIILGAWLLSVAPRVVRLAGELVSALRWTQKVRGAPLVCENGIAFRLHNCGMRTAVTIGAWAPIIVFDHALWNVLSPEDRRAILLHEQGHVERRDGLTLLALRACIAFSPIPMDGRLLTAWRREAEMACDEYAADCLGDPLAVASALVAVEKVCAKLDPTNPAFAALALGVNKDATLESRVHSLLHSSKRENGPHLGNDLLAVFLITLGATAMIAVWPSGTFHHAIETLIGLLVH